MPDGKRPTLAVDERSERGSRESRRLRRSGLVPGIVYGGADGEPLAFKVGARELRQALSEGALLDIQIAGRATRPVIVKDQQHHPVRGDLVHIDMLEVRLDEKIETRVMVELEGVEGAPGVKEGGVLEHVARELTIKALPTDIPERVVVDVSGMEMNATLPLSEVAVPAGVDLLDDPEETVIATITPPSRVEEPEEIEEEAELVGEAAAEEAAAEGDTGEEAEQKGESAAESAEGS